MAYFMLVTGKQGTLLCYQYQPGMFRFAPDIGWELGDCQPRLLDGLGEAVVPKQSASDASI